MTPTGPSSAAPIERPTLTDAAPGVVIVGVMLAVMWGTEIVDALPGVALDDWGIRPRTMRGLFGIVFAPFLHAGFGHLIANTIPFAILGALVALEGARQIVEVTVTVALVSGAGVWLLGASNSVHLGASGVVFGFITYLVTRGWFAGKPLWILGGLVVAAIYGGTVLWGVVPTGRMSWLGHLFGAVGGVLAAWMMHGQDERETPAAPITT